MTDLPIEINGNMRQITSFATLAPGVTQRSYGSVVVEGGASGQINAAGNYYNGLQIDTASDINSDPPYEMVDQFRVIRNLFSARYGMVQGAVDYNMREGTNKLHGDGFIIDRNSVFDSDGFFPGNFNSAGKPIPPVDLETDWGGTIGGPVVLPKLYNGHNKTFFLASFDIYSKNQGQRPTARFPLSAEKQGDFSNFVNSNDQCDSHLRSDDRTAVHGMRRQPAERDLPQPHRPAISKTLLQYIPDPNCDGNELRPGQQQVAGDQVGSVSDAGLGRHASITSFRRARTLPSPGGETTTT